MSLRQLQTYSRQLQQMPTNHFKCRFGFHTEVNTGLASRCSIWKAVRYLKMKTQMCSAIHTKVDTNNATRPQKHTWPHVRISSTALLSNIILHVDYLNSWSLLDCTNVRTNVCWILGEVFICIYQLLVSHWWTVGNSTLPQKKPPKKPCILSLHKWKG